MATSLGLPQYVVESSISGASIVSGNTYEVNLLTAPIDMAIKDIYITFKSGIALATGAGRNHVDINIVSKGTGGADRREVADISNNGAGVSGVSFTAYVGHPVTSGTANETLKSGALVSKNESVIATIVANGATEDYVSFVTVATPQAGLKRIR